MKDEGVGPGSGQELFMLHPSCFILHASSFILSVTPSPRFIRR
jgi:hypothetical protein